MPAFGPIKRKDLVYYLKKLGFAGPFAGSKHEFMERGENRLTLPNPHQSEIGRALLSTILHEDKLTALSGKSYSV